MRRGAHLCGGAELHDVLEARGVQVALGLLAEEVDAALVDAQREVGGQQAGGVLDELGGEEHGVAVGQAAHDVEELQLRVLAGDAHHGAVAALDVCQPLLPRACGQQ